ncbi:unnamed protein product [Ceutorhynchus assimilis]|uniref:Leishmanolysin-like peptidase n=1 Tax=Ceutorhynchus assimilis TaxID=467358 RepID=A0A9N9MEQ8_9CUCU|nr:unnamed protein product [Ceutorhynchus assimilis]
MVKKIESKVAMLFVSVIFVCFWGFAEVFGHKNCQHDYPKHHEVSHTYVEPHHVIRKRNADQPLRIFLYYDQSVYNLDEERFMLINNTILPEAVNFWEKALFVRRADNVIRLTRCRAATQYFCIACRERTMCGEVEVPQDHLDACRVCDASGQYCGVFPGMPAGDGIPDFDFVFYVSAMQTERCNKSLTVAYARHCQQESGLDRPIAGHINLCPDSISTNRQELEVLLSTVKHEISHALGFSVSLYAFYREKDGTPRTERRRDTGQPYLNETLQAYQWSENVIKSYWRTWVVKDGYAKRQVHMMITPNVVREARHHFNCTELEGAELEDQGGEETALTHWEKRVFENEAMTGSHTQNPIISRITLALMEDTGWYIANYSMAGEMSWGKNLGCHFVMKSCKDWMDMRSSKGFSIHPFCNKVKRNPLQTECTDDRTSVALCNLVQYEQQLPRIYQNFDSLQNVGHESYYGGSVSLADYCPYIQEFTWRSNNVVDRGCHCQYTKNNPKPDKNFALEKYGENSLCFEHTNHVWEEKSCGPLRQWMHWGSGCYGYRCQNGRLNILVGNYSYECYHKNQELSIRITSNGFLHEGGIVCPSCEEICSKEFESRGEHCETDEEAPLSNFYPRDDDIQCDSNVAKAFLPLLVLLVAISKLV